VVLGREPWRPELAARRSRVGVETGAVGELMFTAWLVAHGLIERPPATPLAIDPHYLPREEPL
jgi:hypothetical protein